MPHDTCACPFNVDAQVLDLSKHEILPDKEILGEETKFPRYWPQVPSHTKCTPMRTPIDGDRAAGYLVKSSGLMGSVRVSTLDSDEEVWTVYDMAHRLKKSQQTLRAIHQKRPVQQTMGMKICFAFHCYNIARVALVLHQIDPHN